MAFSLIRNDHPVLAKEDDNDESMMSLKSTSDPGDRDDSGDNDGRHPIGDNGERRKLSVTNLLSSAEEGGGEEDPVGALASSSNSSNQTRSISATATVKDEDEKPNSLENDSESDIGDGFPLTCVRALLYQCLKHRHMQSQLRCSDTFPRFQKSKSYEAAALFLDLRVEAGSLLLLSEMRPAAEFERASEYRQITKQGTLRGSIETVILGIVSSPIFEVIEDPTQTMNIQLELRLLRMFLSPLQIL
ncbi:hypothetical protein NP233_g1658 [Leucocoprinus birnbaumii]|uniref:Uncharacterized protein n=1 Tax=Leucocoprinus birnbaumii TaxID=56174 RepID=A0AAD5W059_9AGAR|nr:hypothetical protein NP233_g1658 [Leucocoprinus birnbaumii]